MITGPPNQPGDAENAAKTRLEHPLRRPPGPPPQARIQLGNDRFRLPAEPHHGDPAGHANRAAPAAPPPAPAPPPRPPRPRPRPAARRAPAELGPPHRGHAAGRRAVSVAAGAAGRGGGSIRLRREGGRTGTSGAARPRVRAAGKGRGGGGGGPCAIRLIPPPRTRPPRSSGTWPRQD